MLLRARTVPAGLKALQSLPVELITVGPQRERMAVCVLGRIAGGQVPLICVPGHQRNMSDFAGFANQFRRQIGEDWPVVLVDLKGRGRSNDRANKSLYASPVDAEDLAQIAAALAIERAIFVGQGYGGQVVMALAAQHANLIAGTVLLDAGPVSDPRGLVRLRNNLRILEGHRSESGFRAMTRRILATDYPATPEHILDELAGRTHYLDKRSRVRMLFDPYLIEMLERFEHDDILVPQWQLFGALAEAPLLLMRTQLTEQLRRETFEEMLRRRRDAEGYVIEGQGSPALLNTADDVEPIAEFVRRTAKLRRAAA
jgi:pimeloyl-ACP methyl ester carboxylesterase